MIRFLILFALSFPVLCQELEPIETGSSYSLELIDIVLNVLGLLAIATTLYFTKRSLDVATSALIQDRAWLGVAPDKMSKNEIRDGDGLLVRVDMVYPIKNFGKTPALMVSGKARAARTITDDFYTSVIEATKQPPFNTLAPDTTTFSSILIPGKWIDPIDADNPLRLNVYIAYRYQTIHEETYLLEYESALTITSVIGNRLEYTDQPQGTRNRITRLVS